MQENPLLERIFASVESQEDAAARKPATGARGSKPPRRRRTEAVIAQAVREVVGSVLRVKPDSLRDDQPLTDLGLDSLMGVEIETSLEAAVGVALATDQPHAGAHHRPDRHAHRRPSRRR